MCHSFYFTNSITLLTDELNLHMYPIQISHLPVLAPILHQKIVWLTTYRNEKSFVRNYSLFLLSDISSSLHLSYALKQTKFHKKTILVYTWICTHTYIFICTYTYEHWRTCIYLSMPISYLLLRNQSYRVDNPATAKSTRTVSNFPFLTYRLKQFKHLT